jgi:hypothetical protein
MIQHLTYPFDSVSLGFEPLAGKGNDSMKYAWPQKITEDPS